MKTRINLDRIEEFVCLEPEVGEQLLPLYPDFLSEEKKKQFELHREGCENCQERWKLWQVTGLSLRIMAFLRQAKVFLENQQYEEAIRKYNHAMELAPNVLSTLEGQELFHTDAWLPLTAARTKEKDIMSYIAPSYAPGMYELAAATESFALFPISVEYADGKVQGQFTTAGSQVFFELLEVDQEFKNGVQLVGKIRQGSHRSVKIWKITPGKRHRLGMITQLFGTAEFSEIIQTLRAFNVFFISE